MKDDERDSYCEREHEPTGNLIERRIDVFQGIVTEAADEEVPDSMDMFQETTLIFT